MKKILLYAIILGTQNVLSNNVDIKRMDSLFAVHIKSIKEHIDNRTASDTERVSILFQDWSFISMFEFITDLRFETQMQSHLPLLNRKDIIYISEWYKKNRKRLNVAKIDKYVLLMQRFRYKALRRPINDFDEQERILDEIVAEINSLRKVDTFIAPACIKALSCSQDIDGADIVKYKKAFEYIQNDPLYKGKNIFVSNFVHTNVPRGMFRWRVKSYPVYSEWLDRICDFRIMGDFRSSIIKEIFAKNNSKRYFDNILFFTTIDENTLMAIVFENRVNDKAQTPKWLAGAYFSVFWFHISIDYLFFFDDNDEIEKVVRIQIGS